MFRQFSRHLAQVAGTRVFSLVDAMSHTHHAPALGTGVFKPRFHVFNVADIKELLHSGLGGATVCRSFESTDSAGHGRVHIGLSGRGHPGREGRGVEAVIGQQDQIQIHRACLGLVRRATVEHIQEVSCVIQVISRPQRFQSLPIAVNSGNNGGYFGRQVGGLA